MKWMNFAVKAGFSWPNVPVEIPFGSGFVVLSPAVDDLSCMASLFDAQGMTFEDGATRLARFLSRLAWSMDAGIEVHFAIGTNDPTRPGRLGKGRFATSPWSDAAPWQQLYLPPVLSSEAELGLALYREGLTLNSEPLAFLSFFKVLNIRFSSGNAQKTWIAANLANLRPYGRAVGRLAEVAKNHSDVADYLYVQGRCAVAHAFSSPVADPDEFSELTRLSDDLPLIRELAELFIEQDLGVPSAGSFFRIHRNSRPLPPEFFVPSPTSQGRIRYGPLG